MSSQTPDDNIFDAECLRKRRVQNVRADSCWLRDVSGLVYALLIFCSASLLDFLLLNVLCSLCKSDVRFNVKDESLAINER